MATTGKQQAVRDYYTRLGSRLGYNWVMGGNKHFGYYDKTHTTEKAAQVRFLEKFVELLKPSADLKILDAGCGQGLVATYLARTFKSRVTGITLVPFEVVEARKLAEHQNVKDLTDFRVADYVNPFKRQLSLDTIITD